MQASVHMAMILVSRLAGAVPIARATALNWPTGVCLFNGIAMATPNWSTGVCLFSGIAMGWWARGRFGAPSATTSVPSASSASPAGGFAGVYWDPQAQQRWEIKDACEVIAVCEKDKKKVRGWFHNSVLTLQLKKDKNFEALLRDRELVWQTNSKPWEKQ